MVHLPPLIIDLALILAAAGCTSLLFKQIKQPLVLGYILAGLFVGPYLSIFPTVQDTNSIQVWAEIGVIFLLFSLGLEFSFKKLVKVGGSASITASIEAIFMLLFGYITGKWLGWSTMDSIFLGGILSISSTTIIIRAFEELGVKTQKFAGLVFGILIVEDLIAILLLVLLSTVAVTQQFAGDELLTSILKLAFFLILWFVAGIFLIPTFLNKAKKILNEETILIISIALCLLMVLFSTSVGFSPALGAFIMGSILAETSFGEKIEHLLKPIKELFGAIFFVSVGMLIDPSVLVNYAFPIFLISLVTIFGKTISTTIGALISGQTLKHSIQTGMSLAQIGEFSFIIASLGLTLGVTQGFIYPIAVAVSAITTFTTPFLIRASLPLANRIEKLLPERWINKINNYSSTTQVIAGTSDWKDLIKSNIFNIIIHSVIISAIVTFTSKFIYPSLTSVFSEESSGYIVLGILFIIIAPFIWALSIRRIHIESYANLRLNSKFSKGPLIIIDTMRVGLGILYSGIIVTQYVSNWVEILSILILVGTIIIYFSHILQWFYSKMELRFLTNLNNNVKGEKEGIIPKIVPWDGHLAELQVSPRSELVGKTLLQLGLRERFGLNIGLIERQGFTIPIPSAGETIYPGDRLFLIGTDEQLATIKPIIEVSNQFSDELLSQKNNLVLQKIIITSDSSLVSLTIRESGIKDKTSSLIVGIERNGERILNPESTMRFNIGDIVWIAGNSKALIDYLKIST